MNARDPYLHQNLTPDQIALIEQGMRNTVIDGIPLDPRDTVSNPEKFNSYPLELRRRAFEMLPKLAFGRDQYVDMATGQDVGTTRQVSMQGGDPISSLILGAGIQPAAPQAAAPQAAAPQAAMPTATNTMAQSQVSLQSPNEQQILEAAVPKVNLDRTKVQADPVSSLIMNAGLPTLETQPPPKAQPRSFGDYIKGTGEAALSMVSSGVVAPIAAAEQLVRGGAKPGAPDYFSKRMEAATYQPKTESGQEILQGAAKLFEESKLPPVLTPEFSALSRTRVRPLPGVKVPPQVGVEAGLPPGVPASAVQGAAQAAGRVEPTLGKPKVSYAEFQKQLERKRAGGATADLQGAFQVQQMPPMSQSGANPFFGKFTGEERAKGGQFPQIKESKMANDVPETEQALRAQIATEVLGDENIRPGVITGNEQTLRNEYALAKKAGDTPSGVILREKIAQEQNALSDYAMARIQKTGADQTLLSPNERGSVINNFFAGRTEEGQPPSSLTGFFSAEKTRLYDDARQRVGNNPITTNNVDTLLKDPQYKSGLKLTGNEAVASGAEELINLARTVGFKDRFGTVHAPNTIGAWDAVRKALNDGWTPSNARTIASINQAIDRDIAAAGGGDLIKRADKLHKMEKDTFSSKGIKTIFGEIDSNGVETGLALDKIPKNLNELSFTQWKHIYDLSDNLSKGILNGPIDKKTKQPQWSMTVPEEVRASAQRAKNEMLGNLAREVYEAGAGKAGAWNQRSTNDVLNARADKIRYAFPVEEQKAFNKLNYAGYLMPGVHSYEGAALQERRLGFIERNLAKGGAVAGTALGGLVSGGTGSMIGGYAGGSLGAKMQAKKAVKAEQKKAKTLEAEMKKSGAKAKTIPLSEIGKEK
jgi:hypothetical protein